MADQFLQPGTVLSQGQTVRVEFDFSSQVVTPDILLQGLNAENATGITWTDATLPVFGHGEAFGVVTSPKANTQAVLDWFQAVAEATPDFSIDSILGVYLTNGQTQATAAQTLGLPTSLPSVTDVSGLVKWLAILAAVLGGLYVFKTLRSVVPA